MLIINLGLCLPVIYPQKEVATNDLPSAAARPPYQSPIPARLFRTGGVWIRAACINKTKDRQTPVFRFVKVRQKRCTSKFKTRHKPSRQIGTHVKDHIGGKLRDNPHMKNQFINMQTSKSMISACLYLVRSRSIYTLNNNLS